MTETLLNDFWKAVQQRNPSLAASFEPGLSQERIREALAEADVQGAIEPVLSIFGWRNGVRSDPNLTLEESSPFPASVFGFLDLAAAIDHFNMFHDCLAHHPQFEQADGHYFPLFWDNATGYLAVDLASQSSRVVLLDPESEELARPAYDSLEEFLLDAIRANEENDSLSCFQTR